jgi:hypothetical protein
MHLILTKKKKKKALVIQNETAENEVAAEKEAAKLDAIARSERGLEEKIKLEEEEKKRKAAQKQKDQKKEKRKRTENVPFSRKKIKLTIPTTITPEQFINSLSNYAECRYTYDLLKHKMGHGKFSKNWKTYENKWDNDKLTEQIKGVFGALVKNKHKFPTVKRIVEDTTGRQRKSINFFAPHFMLYLTHESSFDIIMAKTKLNSKKKYHAEIMKLIKEHASQAINDKNTLLSMQYMKAIFPTLFSSLKL